MNKIFPNQPELRASDRRVLAFSNDAKLRVWLKSSRKPDDYRRAILVELERGPKARQPMIHKLILALQKAERTELDKAIMKHLSK